MAVFACKSFNVKVKTKNEIIFKLLCLTLSNLKLITHKMYLFSKTFVHKQGVPQKMTVARKLKGRL